MTTIEKIHHEFNTSCERLLQEATAIVNGNEFLLEKSERLKRIGFSNTGEVKKSKHIKMAAELAALIKDYQSRYPLNKFITDEQVEFINGKYNLVLGPVSCYTGFVPASKLELIEKFKLNANDYRTNRIKIGDFRYLYSQANAIKEFLAAFPDRIISADASEARRSCIVINGRDLHFANYEVIDDQSLCICAPLKDMDVSGMQKVGGFFKKLNFVSIPDPIVLQPVKGGYLILAAWGDEASDPIVVNETQN